jgi:hypothetical protein
VGTRFWATFAAAVLTAALLSACGSSSSDSTASTAGEKAAQSRPETDVSSKDRAEEPKAKKPAEDKGSAEQRPDETAQATGGSDGKHVVVPLQVSGGGSEQFQTKGGDNSIQEFGDEGDESELHEVAEIVHDFYAARVEQQWDKACTYLSKDNIKQLEQLAARAKQENVDCGTVLKAFTRTLPPSLEREITTVDARSFRHDSEQGFLIYYGADKTVYAMPLRAEDGTWKVAALIGTTLG